MIIKNLFLKLIGWIVKRKQTTAQQQNNATNVNIGKIEIHIGKH